MSGSLPEVNADGSRSFLRLMGALGILFALVLAFQLWRLWSLYDATVGDGIDPQTYGFDLTVLQGESQYLVASRLPKDGRLVLDQPRILTMAEVDDLNLSTFRKLIISADPVIGVVREGQARAYPIRFMRWHEIVNDTLGGQAIAVTYHPLCDSSVVFDRDIEGHRVAFGFSGLLYKSNLLLYDRRSDDTPPSLWLQLTAGAMTGPGGASGQKLRVLPMWYGPWEEWRKAHPETTVIAGDPRLGKRYQDNPYAGYFQKGEPWFPVEPLPTKEHASGLALMDPIRAWEGPEGWQWITEAQAAKNPPPADVPQLRSAWFAWHAIGLEMGNGAAPFPIK